MNKRTHKILLLVIAIALAVLPLRGALALPMMTDTGAMSHCAQQGHGAMQDQAADSSDHGCDHDCSGDRCDGACDAHVPAPAALSGFFTVPAGTPDSVSDTGYFHSFTGYTAHPPFRPPISIS